MRSSVFRQRANLAAHLPSTIIVATIIIAYFNCCNNNFHIGK
jgi:hypothetical protein